MRILKINSDTHIGDTGITLANFLNMFNNKSIYDSGYDSNHMYIRFNDGTMIQGKVAGPITFDFAIWYDCISYHDFDLGNWVIPFKSGKPLLLLNDWVRFPGSNSQAWVCNTANLSYTSAGTLRLCRVADLGGVQGYNWTVYLTRICWGYWK